MQKLNLLKDKKKIKGNHKIKQYKIKSNKNASRPNVFSWRGNIRWYIVLTVEPFTNDVRNIDINALLHLDKVCEKREGDFTERTFKNNRQASHVAVSLTHQLPLTVLPPLPITLPAAVEGTLMCVSSLTSSLAVKKFSSFSFPYIRPWAWKREEGWGQERLGQTWGQTVIHFFVVVVDHIWSSKRLKHSWNVHLEKQFALFVFTLNWASGVPVMITILSVTSGFSAGAIWETHTHTRRSESHMLLLSSSFGGLCLLKTHFVTFFVAVVPPQPPR